MDRPVECHRAVLWAAAINNLFYDGQLNVRRSSTVAVEYAAHSPHRDEPASTTVKATETRSP